MPQSDNPALQADILTLFPEMFPGPLAHSLAGKALDNGIWTLNAIDIRDFADDKHRTVDSPPYGGGAGMVLRADVLGRAVSSLHDTGPIIVPGPRGRPLTQNMVRDLAEKPRLSFVCGRYEGIDQRFFDAFDVLEVSIGDYILSGGEMATLTILDAVIRLLPGVLGNIDTHARESFSDSGGHGQLLEYPHYTRPAEWTAPDGNAYPVPAVLRSGNHQKIDEWRRQQAVEITKERRPDLIDPDGD
jgi:tRNA (guanine37-N1)-methyltransferase